MDGWIRWCCFRSCWMALSHVMRGCPGCLLQSAGGEADRSLGICKMCPMCPNRVSRCNWIIAESLRCFVSLCYLSVMNYQLGEMIRVPCAKSIFSLYFYDSENFMDKIFTIKMCTNKPHRFSTHAFITKHKRRTVGE